MGASKEREKNGPARQAGKARLGTRSKTWESQSDSARPKGQFRESGLAAEGLGSS